MCIPLILTISNRLFQKPEKFVLWNCEQDDRIFSASSFKLINKIQMHGSLYFFLQRKTGPIRPDISAPKKKTKTKRMEKLQLCHIGAP